MFWFLGFRTRRGSPPRSQAEALNALACWREVLAAAARAGGPLAIADGYPLAPKASVCARRPACVCAVMADLVAPKLDQLGGGIAQAEVGSSTERYTDYFDESKSSTEALRKKRLDNYADVVNTYYDLATSFYEFGWRARVPRRNCGGAWCYIAVGEPAGAQPGRAGTRRPARAAGASRSTSRTASRARRTARASGGTSTSWRSSWA